MIEVHHRKKQCHRFDQNEMRDEVVEGTDCKESERGQSLNAAEAELREDGPQGDEAEKVKEFGDEPAGLIDGRSEDSSDLGYNQLVQGKFHRHRPWRAEYGRFVPKDRATIADRLG